MKIVIKEAQKEDMIEVMNLIKELANFEKEPKEVEIDSTVLVNDGFKETSYFKSFVAKNENKIVGAAYFIRYSTWKGRTIHLEDLIVTKNKQKIGDPNGSP